MITGFNTDVDSGGVVYHVQTEDKGLETPFLLTLVYDGGTILASKRQPYEDLFKNGFNEKELEARLNRQHTLICAAIKAGRINDLVALNKRDARRVGVRSGDRKINEIPRPVDSAELVAPITKPIEARTALEDFGDADPMVEVLSVIEDEFELPFEAIEIVSDMAGTERPSHNKLCIEFVNETPLKGGESRTITFMVCRGSDRKVVGNAQILVKILGSNLRPQIFHSVTDQNGLARMELELPAFTGGRAAFLVRASSAGEEIEVRRAIRSS